MQSVSYKSYDDKNFNSFLTCNRTASHYPIIVNCVGRMVLSQPFITDNPKGRLDYYFLYLKSGKLSLTINDIPYIITSGTLVIIPPNTKYSYSNVSDGVIYYYVHFTGSSVMEVLGGVAFNSLPLVKQLLSATPLIEKNMFSMFNVNIKKEEFCEAQLANIFTNTLISIAKLNKNKQVENQKLITSINYINQNYTSDIEIATLANMEFLSVSRYVTVFKETVGMPPYQYVISLRLNSACEMLKNTNLSVTQIAEALGFNSCFFFSKLFKKHLKLSPNQYKKMTKPINQIDLKL